MAEIGLECPKAEVAKTYEQAVQTQAKVGFPTIIRPSFTLGGRGAGIAYTVKEFEEIVKRGLELSPVNAELVEESVLGWKEFEDRKRVGEGKSMSESVDLGGRPSI